MEINSQWMDMRCVIPETAPQMTEGENEIQKFFCSRPRSINSQKSLRGGCMKKLSASLATMMVLIVSVPFAISQTPLTLNILERVNVGGTDRMTTVRYLRGRLFTGNLPVGWTDLLRSDGSRAWNVGTVPILQWSRSPGFYSDKCSRLHIGRP